MRKIVDKYSTPLIWLWFILLAVLFTRPLLAHCVHEVTGEIGDNIYFIWMIGWLQKALLKLRCNPLNVWFLNYPEGWNMAHTEMTPAQLALALPFSLVNGETFAFNMVMLLSFVLSGVITYGWVSRLSGSKIAGWISGTIFACLPYRQAHFLIGHLNLSGTQWLPLFFWGWFDLLKPGDGELRKKPALVAAIGLGLTALTSQYYFFMAVVIAAVQVLFILFFDQRQKWRDKAFWQSCGVFIAASVPLLLIAELPFLTLAGSGGMPDREWGSVRMYSAGLSDYLLPGTTHFLFGDWVGQHFNRDLWIEATLYVGMIALILFLIGVCSKNQSTWLKKMLLSGVIAAVILSMGTDLHWNAQAIEWTLPAFLRDKLGRDTLPILLPGFFLFKYFPFYAKLRAMMRFGIFALLLIAVGAGFGVNALLERTSSLKREVLVCLLLLLVVFDYFPKAFPRFDKVSAREADFWLAEQEGDGSVMRYPFSLNDDQAGTYYTLYNQKPFIGGFFNAFPTEQYQRIKNPMNGFPSAESLELAKSLKVDFVLVEADELVRQIQSGEVPWSSAEELFAAAREFGLEPVKEFENITIYRLDRE